MGRNHRIGMPEVSYIEPGPDTFRILLTTDNHVGYMENDQIRGDDSWRTFAEILSIGRENDVDMIVQGGDLFHVNSPSKKSYYHVMRSLREHCWCDKPIEYKLVSDPSDAMATKHFVYPAEYDLNVNVGMPVYAISGNHDDATGEELLSPLDVLSVAGLLNHFGRVIDNEQITVCPLLFNKGKTNLALYGLHSIREERLMKTMASGNLEFLEPDTSGDANIQWFNLMCIHQNHVHRPGVKVVEETFLPTFLDFVLWGHEHDCKPVAVKNDITGSYILQAGSSIATSLSEGETLNKHVYILSIKGKDFSLKPIRLKTVRSFVMKDVVLKNTGLSATSSNKKEVLNFLMMEVELMIGRANSLWKEANIELFDEGIFKDEDIPLPLIRLRVEYSGGYEVENPRYFSNRFVGKVANINDVVLFYKRKSQRSGTNGNGNKLLVGKGELKEEVLTDNDDDAEFVENKENDIFDIITEKLNDNELIMLTKKKVSEALETLVNHEENRSILNKFVRNEEADHIELLEQLTLDGNGTMDLDGDELVVTSNVKDVKKSFKELAKRIKAETQYSTSATDGGNVMEVGADSGGITRKAASGPILFNRDDSTATVGEAPKGRSRGIFKRKESVVESSSSEEEREREAQKGSREDDDDGLENSNVSTALFDIPMPSSVIGTTRNSRRVIRERARATINSQKENKTDGSRSGPKLQSKRGSFSALDMLLQK